MLQIKNLHASVEDKDILKGINLEIKAGEVMTDQMVLENQLYLHNKGKRKL